MQPLKLKVQFQPGTRRADGSVTLKQVTAQEIETKDFADIDAYRGQIGWLMFKPNDFSEADIPKENADVEGKTPSKRLYNVLYVLHQQSGGGAKDFRQFYEQQMERFIDKVKEKLQ